MKKLRILFLRIKDKIIHRFALLTSRKGIPIFSSDESVMLFFRDGKPMVGVCTHNLGTANAIYRVELIKIPTKKNKDAFKGFLPAK